MSDLLRGMMRRTQPPSNDIPSNHRKKSSYEPTHWSEFFNIRDDIELDVGTFRIYRRGVEGPLLFFIHGGGFSGLTWAILSALITDEVKCQCLAVDMRGHGDTKCQDDNDFSVDTLAKDVIKIIFAMYPTEAPPIILVGHSMGGAVAVHVACKRTIPSLAGLVVIDVVEGSAMEALHGMKNFLRGRPQTFRSLSHAIEWSIRSSQLRNVQSARVSFPGQLKRIQTNETATSELDRGVAIIHACSSRTSSKESSEKPMIPTLTEVLEENEGVNTEADNPRCTFNHVPQIGGASPPSTLIIPPLQPDVSSLPDHSVDQVEHQLSVSSPGESSQSQYTWRIDLSRTERFWSGWFSGLSKNFLSIPEPKLLMLAGVDRLDKELTIGQMQGKFQVFLFPKAGHAVQEDVPEMVANGLANFLVRNRFTEAKCSN